jgi:hypothetical protein
MVLSARIEEKEQGEFLRKRVAVGFSCALQHTALMDHQFSAPGLTKQHPARTKQISFPLSVCLRRA